MTKQIDDLEKALPAIASKLVKMFLDDGLKLHRDIGISLEDATVEVSMDFEPTGGTPFKVFLGIRHQDEDEGNDVDEEEDFDA
jgi:hypothetical protein